MGTPHGRPREDGLGRTPQGSPGATGVEDPNPPAVPSLRRTSKSTVPRCPGPDDTTARTAGYYATGWGCENIDVGDGVVPSQLRFTRSMWEAGSILGPANKWTCTPPSSLPTSPMLSRLALTHASSGVVFVFASLRLTQALFRSLAPLGDRVLVKRVPKEVQTAGGLYLPTDKAKDPNEGSVIAVGPGERDVTGQLHPTTLKEGDQVLLPEYGGTKVKVGDDEYVLFRESDVLGKFE